MKGGFDKENLYLAIKINKNFTIRGWIFNKFIFALYMVYVELL